MSASFAKVTTTSPLTVTPLGLSTALKAHCLASYTPAAGDLVAFEPLNDQGGSGYVLVLGKYT